MLDSQRPLYFYYILYTIIQSECLFSSTNIHLTLALHNQLPINTIFCKLIFLKKRTSLLLKMPVLVHCLSGMFTITAYLRCQSNHVINQNHFFNPIPLSLLSTKLHIRFPKFTYVDEKFLGDSLDGWE